MDLHKPERKGWGDTEDMNNGNKVLKSSIVYFFAVVICVFSVIPVLWGLSTSFKTDKVVYAIPPVWLPKPVTFANYVSVFHSKDMMRYFLNTMIISFFSTVISMIIGVLAAYGFSRYKFPGCKTLLWSILFTRVLPRVTIVIPFYITLRNLKLLNTYAGLVLVYLMVVMPITVWLLKGFFDNVPYEIEEAAIVDGCSPLKILTKIVLPISLPAIASVGMYSFILAWNEFLFALIMTNDRSTRPIAVGLAFYIDEMGVHWGPLMAASIMMSIPAIIIFSLSQRHLVKGLGEGAVKG